MTDIENTQTQLINDDHIHTLKRKNITDFNSTIYHLDHQNTTFLDQQQQQQQEDEDSNNHSQFLIAQNDDDNQQSLTGEAQSMTLDSSKLSEDLETVKKEEKISDLITKILTEKKIRKKKIVKNEDDDQENSVQIKRAEKKQINGVSFRSQRKCENMKQKHWNQKEEDMFYRLMGVHGMDWNVIAYEMGSKTRKQVMAKYNKEDKVNGWKIDLALKGQLFQDRLEIEQQQ